MVFAAAAAAVPGSGPLAPQAADWEPLLPGWIILLPLLGFVANSLCALLAARQSSAAVRAGGEWDPFAGGKRPLTHTLPTWIGPGVMALAFLLTLWNFEGMWAAHLDEPVVEKFWTWIVTSTLTVDAAVQLDQLSMIMMLVVTGVGFLIHVFSVGYMRDDVGYPRYFAYLNLFVFFMLVLVMGAGYAMMFIGWEGVGLCSYLLIGYWFTDREKSDAGKKAFIVNRIGDFGFLVAMFLLYQAFGTLEFAGSDGIFANAEGTLAAGGATVTAITLLLMLGAAGKSAQVPLHVWLPDAMAGPTPVSALIHAATMVTAGVYMVARSSFLYALAPTSQAVVAGIGVLTALIAATIALKQYDIKKVLAYSTVSQLGFMFLGAGVGAFTAAIFHLMTHAFFKALLFLGAGAVIHSMHHALHKTGSHEDAQDMRNMGGLRTRMRITWVVMWIATLAIAGIWPFAGFFSKDEIIWYTAAWAGAESNPYGWLYTVYWLVALATALLTAFYMTRLMIMTFHGSSRVEKGAQSHLHEAPRVMTVPLIILAVLSVFGGWVNVPEELQASVVGFFGTLPMSEWLHHWLEPVTAGAAGVQVAAMGDPSYSAPLVGGGEVMWALISTLAAALVVAGACRYLLARKYVPAAEAAAPSSGLGRILYNKWYFDELFDRTVVQPILAASRWCWKVVDNVLIDGFVNFVGNFTRLAGWIASLFQTGQATTYAFVLTLGVLAILGAAVFLQ
ncbi:MAG: NADH-quinone oxidoreductase subunit L [Gemmatimonadetes bacterium]|nr:NADH-quinone oxidoreductase subunit L [Gemmatimonadota bacterium]MDE2677349.1 NADH-quinone oxidoreductase subunit L [Gemmatimonadota bacterium]MXX34078.1 NADH-quinone oxidoreductase subunit L [Gemmatimonadota bacterium]MYD12735.1 NADH-quinone oxidoreductase subunit L [Gemmatimonadota bacterium]MYE70492.1 NADH-quinone oxidoreductase subunit L [Gemmatimonadota bacterium]